MKPIVLLIMDGLGISDKSYGNAVTAAKMPNFKRFLNTFPNTKLTASGTAVGLPANQMGNSEVGHLHIGAGEVIEQPFLMIEKSLKTKKFMNQEAIKSLINHVQKHNSNLHILGLCSDGGVHSHLDNIIEIIKQMADVNINIYLHLITDGRDTPPKSALKYINEVSAIINEYGGQIRTIMGRYYAMDRDKRYERTKIAYDALTMGIGQHTTNYQAVIEENYNQNITDEFFMPMIMGDKGNISTNDAVLFVNWRPDRGIQLLSALSNKKINLFDEQKIDNLFLVSMFSLNDTVIGKTIFEHQMVRNPLGVILADHNKKQLRLAETEKYAHVTYFFDGGKELDLKGCDRELIPSPKVTTYDLTPEMSAWQIKEKLIAALDNNEHDFILINFANADMLGHTGNFEATIKALETIDSFLGEIETKINQVGGLLIITADHGNAEEMLFSDGTIKTAHTSNPAPFIILNNNYQLKKEGSLIDIAPTILSLFALPQPITMTGENLIKIVNK